MGTGAGELNRRVPTYWFRSYTGAQAIPFVVEFAHPARAQAPTFLKRFHSAGAEAGIDDLESTS